LLAFDRTHRRELHFPRINLSGQIHASL
jgi:hypothetical protein